MEEATQEVAEVTEVNLDTLTMEELVTHFNQLAYNAGKKPVESFKSLKAGRTAIEKLVNAAKFDAFKAAGVDPNAEAADGDKPKRAGTATIRGPVQGVGAFAKARILEGASNKEALASVQEQFPDAKTSMACIAYYRNKLVTSGQLAARVTKKQQQEAETEAVAETEEAV